MTASCIPQEAQRGQHSLMVEHFAESCVAGGQRQSPLLAGLRPKHMLDELSGNVGGFDMVAARFYSAPDARDLA